MADMTSDESLDWTFRLLTALKISREAMIAETLKLHERLAELDPANELEKK